MNAHIVLHTREIAARSTYLPSRRGKLPAVLIAAGGAAGMLSSFLLMQVPVLTKPKPVPLVVELLAMPQDPPAPPEPARREPRKQPEPRLAVALPVAAISMPAPVAVAVSPQPVPSTIAAPPMPAVAPAASLPARGPASGGELSGKVLVAKPPVYPIDSRRFREEGTVVLAVLLSADGCVAEVSVAKSSGHFRLDRAALSAVRHWRWSPFERDGEPVLVRGLVTIPFVLSV